jgi:hypothetical protein
VRNHLRSRWRSAAAVVVSVLTIGVSVGPGDRTIAADSLVLVSRFRPEVGSLGPATVIGDSVLLGSLHSPWGTTLDQYLVAGGWGPIQARAGAGDTTSSAASWITTWRSRGWDPPDVLVNLGANDSNGCAGDEACSYDAIMHLVDVIGPGHRIWWPKITRFPVLEHHAFAWNRALDRVAAERPDEFVTWDWPTIMYRLGNYASDHTHLTVAGYLERSELMARQFTIDMAMARRVGSDAPLPSPLGDPAGYVPIGPVRVTDTRTDPPGRLPAGGTLTVDLGPYLPDGTTAVAVNLTSTGSPGRGFLTAHPCDRARGTTSNLNHPAGRSRGALAVVPVDPDGRLCVFAHAGGHVVVDLQGAFVPNGGSLLTPLDEPDRLLDSRITGRAPAHEIAVPDGVDAVAVNLTATGATSRGWLRADDCDTDTEVSNLNFGPGESVAGAAFVPVSAAGTICVTTLVAVDVIVDITGSFSDDGRLRFQAAEPRRVLDLRSGTGGWAPVVGRTQALDVRVAPATAEAVTGTVTIVRPLTRGWARAAGCGTPSTTSSVNALSGDVMANSVTTGVDAGRLCITTSTVAPVLFDTTGWWVPAPAA